MRHLTCAKAAWDNFSEIHRRKGPARKILLFKKLLYLNMSEGSAVADHLNEFCGIRESLAAIDVDIPEEMLVIILLSSLPVAFENFVVAMETRDALPSLNVLKVKVLEEGARQNACVQKYETSTETLMHAKSDARGNFQNKGNITNCTKNSNNNKNSKNIKKLKCFNCGKYGHFAAACRQPKNNVYKQDGNSYERSCFIMNTKNLNGKKSSTHTWCVDSGATSHLCCDRNLFQNYSSVSEKIWLAGGLCIEAVGRGDVDVGGTTVMLKNVLYVPNLQCNFVSVSKAIESGHTVTFERAYVVIKNNKNRVLMKAFNNNGLFVYEYDKNKCFSTVVRKDENDYDNAYKWHYRY